MDFIVSTNMGRRCVRSVIRFLLNTTLREIKDASPTMTVLEYLRSVERLTGTKEGCAEGDCGACTVVIGEGGTYRAVNACILFLPALDGKQLLTIEHLRGPDGTPHAVQEALVRHHGSQCGFCTPGIAMSMFALRCGDDEPDRVAINEALAGNLCRCTGYRPIIDAAMDPAIGAAASVRPATIDAVDVSESLVLQGDAGSYHAPRTIDELTAVLDQHPGATLVAGGTDVGLWITKQHRDLPAIVALDAVEELGGISSDATTIRIGAAASYEAALPALEQHYPSLGKLIRRIGSRQIRNRGTIGGNLANASPIGDMPPALMALDAQLILRSATARRMMPVDAFFLGYRKTALASGEFIEAIELPKHAADFQFRVYKVSKRIEQDISAVCGAFGVTIAEGVVQTCRIGLGGMAATPVRARNTEAALLGQPWCEATIRSAMTILAAEFQPISDMRASAAYRSRVAGNLLLRFFLEISEAPRLARVAGHA